METLKVIKTLTELEALNKELQSADFVAYDTETTGLDKDAKIIGYSVSFDVESAYYVVLAYWDTTKESLVYLETIEGTPALLRTLQQKSLIMHNSVFDCARTFDNFKIDLMPSLHTDTMILANLLDENRRCGLKELGIAIYDRDAGEEQIEMKASVIKNGGVLTREKYELYKADADLLGKYGAKDALLTLNLFYYLVEDLVEQGLYDFFYKDECLPQIKGPTYELNTQGLKVDTERLKKLKAELETECLEAKAFIYNEIAAYIKEDFPGTKPANTFNIDAPKQLAWLLFHKLGNYFDTLTEGGRELCQALSMPLPYSLRDKRHFIETVTSLKGSVYQEAKYNPKTKKMGRPKKVADVWHYMKCSKDILGELSSKYRWVDRLLAYKKAEKILSTYVIGIQDKLRYGVVHPGFLQHGTTSGRYSSKSPNFQNLPRDDKRVKACVVSRPGKVFVGADYSQLEPRVFASMSGDTKLLQSFENGDDFYSVIGAEVFEKFDCSLKKDAENSFANKYPKLRQESKVFGLASVYGANARRLSKGMGKSVDEAQDSLDSYFRKFSGVAEFILRCHEQAKIKGFVTNLFGRPRRMPEAKKIQKFFPKQKHAELPYEYRNILNLATNHTVQSTGASIVNRAMIAFAAKRDALGIKDAPIVLTVHDEIVVECREQDAEIIAEILKDAMENTVKLPGVKLEAKPVIGKTLADLK